MNPSDLKIELSCKQERLKILEQEINDLAKEHKLGRKYKTIDELHETVKKALRWQDDNGKGIIYIIIETVLGQIFGPRCWNVEINKLLEKRVSILEEIDEITLKLLLYKNIEKSDANIKQTTKTRKKNVVLPIENKKLKVDDPDDLRNKLLNVPNQDCFILNENDEYAIKNYKGTEFVDICFENELLWETKELDKNDFGMKWLYEHALVSKINIEKA